jgi:hypothetical protein
MAGQPRFFDLDERYAALVGGGRSALAAGVARAGAAVPAAEAARPAAAAAHHGKRPVWTACS